ncbi:MAG TPA: CRISPR-associated helicase Cas3' [Thermodesulfobacteriota bacterium]|nr:CRISPR-associated helicase Cas3' [Thermodesulfobacteriota bacterium]
MEKVNLEGIGRIFFKYDSTGLPTRAIIHTLSSHQANTRFLIESFQSVQKELVKWKENLARAAEIHDCGKIDTFDLRLDKKDGKYILIYSFRGHPYRQIVNELASPDTESLVNQLIKNHHKYSVESIVQAVNLLRRQGENPDTLFEYPELLYSLELADQIEAESATWAIDGDASSRTFMDVELRPEKRSNGEIYLHVHPWAFVFDIVRRDIIGLEIELEDKFRINKWWEETNNLKNHIEEKLREAIQIGRFQPVHSYYLKKPPEVSYTFIDGLLKKDNVDDTYRLIGGDTFKPNALQREAFDLFADDDISSLILAPTGSGKTEAILFPALSFNKRLILVLPARSLVDDQRKRIDRYLKHLSGQIKDQQFSCIVDTGSQIEHVIYRGGQPQKAVHKPDRHFYSANIILTTLDKFIYRFFGYGAENKAYIYPRRIHRDIKKKKTVVVFDEAHSYEDVAFTNFLLLVESLYTNGVGIVVMTATMPKKTVKELTFLQSQIDFTSSGKLALLNRKSGDKTLKYISAKLATTDEETKTENLIINLTLKEVLSRYTSEKHIIVVFEKVEDAAEVYKKLEVSGEIDAKNLILYHGRLPDEERKDRYSKLKELNESNRGYVLVTTSAIEVGCDLDAHVLITQLPLPENLIQRAGRCNRKDKKGEYELIVIGNEIPKFLRPQWDEETYKEWFKNYIDELNHQDGGIFNVQRIKEHIKTEPLFDYRIEMLFGLLYDYVYNFNILNSYLHKQGFIITRSWEPRVTLTTTRLEPHTKATENLKNAIEVGIESLAISKTRWDKLSVDEQRELIAQANPIFEKVYNYDKGGWYWERARSGRVYFKELIIVVSESSYDEKIGHVKLPKIFVSNTWRNSYTREFNPVMDLLPRDETSEKSKKGKAKNSKQARSFTYSVGIPLARSSGEEASESEFDEGAIIA